MPHEEVKRIAVPAKIGKLHPLVEKTRVALEKGRLDEYHVINTRWDETLNVRVSESLISRAIRILDVIVKEAERKSYKVGLSAEGLLHTY